MTVILIKRPSSTIAEARASFMRRYPTVPAEIKLSVLEHYHRRQASDRRVLKSLVYIEDRNTSLPPWPVLKRFFERNMTNGR